MKVKRNIMLPFGVQMGHDWGIPILAYFHASGKPQKPSSPTAAKLHAPKHFYRKWGISKIAHHHPTPSAT